MLGFILNLLYSLEMLLVLHQLTIRRHVNVFFVFETGTHNYNVESLLAPPMFYKPHHPLIAHHEGQVDEHWIRRR